MKSEEPKQINISAVIKSIRNIMRKDKGLNGDAQRIEQLGWMLFLKIFDAKDIDAEDMDETGNYLSPVPKKLQWRNWAEDDEGITGEPLIQFIDHDLFPALKNLEGEGKREGIIRDVFIGNNNYMKSGQLFRKIVNELNKIDFKELKNRQVFGTVYESILKELQNAGKSGEFYTPRALTEFIADRLKPQIGEKILDPACGTGGFLTACIDYMRKSGVDVLEKREELQNTLQGMELKPLPHMLALTNLILHDIEAPNIVYEDALLNNENIDRTNRVDLIVANPPFGGNVDDETADIYPSKYRTKESADLFLVMMVNYLKKNGRAGIVLPDGSLTGDGVKAKIREKLLQECRLHTIVRLPNSVFKPYAQVSTNLLFFEKMKRVGDSNTDFETKEIWYYEHKLPKGAKSYSKTKPIRVAEFEPLKKWWDNREESELAWKIDFAKVLEDAKTKAQPHYENAKKARREASKLKKQISELKEELKEAKKEGKSKETQKKVAELQTAIKKLDTPLKEAETKAHIQKQTADSLYYAAFDLDYKNPHVEEEEKLDPKELLEKLNLVESEMQVLQNSIKNKFIQINKEGIFILNFNRLTSKGYNIPILRQSILQLAVQGKLTEQWRNNSPFEGGKEDVETGAELLEKIKAEKQKLIQEKKIKRQKLLPEIEVEEIPFEVPDSWVWTRLGHISEKIHYGFNASAKPMEKEVRLLRITDIQNNKVDWENVPGCEYRQKDIDSYRLNENDILIARTGGTIGKSYLVKNISVVSLFASYLIRVISSNKIFPEFLKMYIESPVYWQQLYDYAWGGGQPNVNATNLKKLLVTLPPLPEQKIIVQKVEKLLAWCDALEEKIEKSEQYHRQLMQTAVRAYA